MTYATLPSNHRKRTADELDRTAEDNEPSDKSASRGKISGTIFSRTAQCLLRGLWASYGEKGIGPSPFTQATFDDGKAFEKSLLNHKSIWIQALNQSLGTTFSPDLPLVRGTGLTSKKDESPADYAARAASTLANQLPRDLTAPFALHEPQLAALENGTLLHGMPDLLLWTGEQWIISDIKCSEEARRTHGIQNSRYDLIQRHFYPDIALKADKNTSAHLLENGAPFPSLVKDAFRHKSPRLSRSQKEVARVVDWVKRMLTMQVVLEKEVPRLMTTGDIAILTPFRTQASAITQAIRAASIPDSEKLRLGTVDKMQGQGTAAVIYSTASSSKDYIANQAEWLFSSNRWNVAISRALACAIVVGDLDAHLHAEPKSLDGIAAQQKIREVEEDDAWKLLTATTATPSPTPPPAPAPVALTVPVSSVASPPYPLPPVGRQRQLPVGKNHRVSINHDVTRGTVNLDLDRLDPISRKFKKSATLVVQTRDWNTDRSQDQIHKLMTDA